MDTSFFMCHLDLRLKLNEKDSYLVENCLRYHNSAHMTEKAIVEQQLKYFTISIKMPFRLYFEYTKTERFIHFFYIIFTAYKKRES